MLKFLFPSLLSLCIVGTPHIQAQQRSTTLIQSTLDDERVDISINKSVYLPGDTVLLVIQRNDSATTITITPTLLIEGTNFKSIGRGKYVAVIPQTTTPGSYPITLRVKDSEGRRFGYETGCVVTVEEFQAVEQLSNYVSIAPLNGSSDPETAVSLDNDRIRDLHVVFRRDSIRSRMGPQFITIRTMVQAREGSTVQTFERRVLTFRSHGNPERDRAMFIQYRTAYGAYAAISMDEVEQVHLPFEDLPAWAMVKVDIKPDYTIKIGAYDRLNSITRYFRARGPAIEVGFSLGIPKVLHDTQARDTVEYGHSSAMVRFYIIDKVSANRFPVSFGFGTFGVDSPIDVGIGRGGFALPVFLDLIELLAVFNIQVVKKIHVGVELTPFFSIGRKPRILFDAQVFFTI